jgi:iron complex outermembrane receptor protein
VPFDAWTVEVSYTDFDNNRESNPNASLIESAGALNCGTVRSGNHSLYCGALPNDPGSVSADPRSYGAVTSSQIFRAATSLKLARGLTASYLFGRVTGTVDIANLTVANNANCGANCTFQNAPIGNIHYDSHEARLVYDTKGWHFAVGGFLSKGFDNYGFDVVVAPNITSASSVQPLKSTTGAITIPLTRTLTTTLVRSAFAEGQWTSSDGATRLGVEGRYSSTRVQALNKVSGALFAQTFNILTPRFTAEHDLAPHMMLYASAAEGTKTGGFNPTAVNVSDRYYGPEKNWTYELGSKNVLMNGKLTFNADVFYTRWTGIQINSPDSGSSNPNAVNITLNLGNANVYGVEFDTVFMPNRHWSFDGNFSYSDARYSDGTRDARFSRTVSPCDNVVCPSTGSIAGNQIERTPPAKGAFGAQWQTDMPWDHGSVFIRGDVTWQSKFYDTPMNLGWIPARTLVNTRMGISYKTIDLSFWVRNAFDKKYVSNAYVVILPSGNSYQLFYGQRRSLGATIKVKY